MMDLSSQGEKIQEIKEKRKEEIFLVDGLGLIIFYNLT